MSTTKTNYGRAIYAGNLDGLLMATAPLAAEQFTETEAILPFVMEHRVVPNPALDAWNAAPSDPCGAGYCVNSELDVYYHIPASAKAVVYVFHGGSGSAQMWITGEQEAALLGDPVRSRYAVVLLESTHRPLDSNWFFPDPARFNPNDLPQTFTPTDDPWNATVNADEHVVRNVHALLGYDTNTQVFLAGFSSGAKFAGAMAYSPQLDPPALDDYGYMNPRMNTGGGLNVRAAAMYNNVAEPYYFGNYHPGPLDPASVPLAAQYTTPTIFNYGLNDDGNPTSEVEANADFLTTLPVPVEKNLAESARLRPDRFARVLGMSYAESRDLYAALADPAHVDAHGFVLSASDTAPAVLAPNAPHHLNKGERLCRKQNNHGATASAQLAVPAPAHGRMRSVVQTVDGAKREDQR